MRNREQRAGKRVLAGLEKTKRTVLELGVVGKEERHHLKSKKKKKKKERKKERKKEKKAARSPEGSLTGGLPPSRAGSIR